MSLSSVEREILETMFLNGNPINATQITSMGNNQEDSITVIEPLVKLARMGYVNSLLEDMYMITKEGKKALGIQLITKEEAKKIMAYTPHDKAFNFHVNADTSLHMHAHSLQDFANKIVRIDLKTIEYHMCKGEFENWFKCLGDQELTKKAVIIKERKITGEKLQRLFHDIVTQRCQELMKLIEEQSTV
ncbi:MAG: hypothetical protein LBH62_09760 [Nitrososphaerota archaeon]|nr:hypothetical protein [Nitrososphaerota archaeon]